MRGHAGRIAREDDAQARAPAVLQVEGELPLQLWTVR